MNASLFQIHKFRRLGLIGAALLFCYVASAPVLADDRMAGHQKHQTKSASTTINWNRDFPDTTKAQKLRAESLGVFTTTHQGGLGNDLWYGSRRKNVIELLEDLPTHTDFQSINELTTRLLLTSADTSVLDSQNFKRSSQNLLLIRFKKLMERGYFDRIAEIYKELTILPPYPEVAEIGITALLMNNESAIACLETNALIDYAPEKHVTFWQHMERICTHVLENKLSPVPSEKTSNQENSETNTEEEANSEPYPVLEKLLAGTIKKYKPKTEDEIESLKPLEVAFLNATNKWDLSKLTKKPQKITKPFTLSLMIKAQALKPSQQLKYLLRAIELGYSLKEDLASFYAEHDVDKELLEITLPTAKFLEAIKKKGTLYKLSASYQRLQITREVEDIKRILDMVHSLDIQDTALFSFIKFTPDTYKDHIPPKQLLRLVRIYLQSQTPLPKGWLDTTISQLNQTISEKTSDTDKAKTFSQIVGFMNQNTWQMASVSAEFLPDFKDLAATIPAELLGIAKKYYEKLDSNVNISQYAARDSYENPSGLTTENNYVMPSVDLLNRLTLVNKKKLMGETILLSCLVLNETRADTLHLDVFRRITDSLVNVGLTENAQRFTVEVILSREYE